MVTTNPSYIGPTIRQLLDLPGTEDIEFDPPRFGDRIFRVPDLDELADFQS